MTERTAALKTDWRQNGLGLLALILALANLVQGYYNRKLQDDVVSGQAQLGKAQTLANVNNSLVQLLAKAAAENNDNDIRDLLARNGVTFKANAPVQPKQEPTDEEK